MSGQFSLNDKPNNRIFVLLKLKKRSREEYVLKVIWRVFPTTIWPFNFVLIQPRTDLLREKVRVQVMNKVHPNLGSN